MNTPFSTGKTAVSLFLLSALAGLALPTSADTIIGDAGDGTFDNTGTDNVTGNLILGNQVSVTGTYTITGNSSQTNISFVPGGNGGNPNGALIVGNAGTGSFTQGTDVLTDPDNQVNVAGDVTLGQQPGSVGTYVLNSGTLTIGGQIAVGGQSTEANSFTQNGGTLNLTNTASGNADYVSVGPAFQPFGGALAVGGGIGTGDGSNSGGKGSYTLNDGTINATNVLIGPTGTGTMTQLSGTINTSFLQTGFFASTGTYTMSGGTINAQSETHGFAGTGVFKQSGGQNVISGGLFVGENCCGNTLGQGTYNLTGGVLTTGNTLVGDGEMGTFVVSDADAASTHTVTGNLIVGGQTGGVGAYSITGDTAATNVTFASGGNGPADPPGSNGTTFDPNLQITVDNPAPNGALIVGNFATGTFTQGLADQSDTGNVVNVAGDLVLGNQLGSLGQYTLNTGTLTVDGKMVVGGASKDANLFTQNSGTVTITGLANGNPDYVGVGGNDFVGSLLIGGGVNELDQGSGTYVLNNDGVLNAGLIAVGSSGVGVFNQTGGKVNTSTLWLGNCGGCNGGNSAGSYNLTGNGTLIANSESVGLFGHGEFYQGDGSGLTTHTVSGTLAIGDGPNVYHDDINGRQFGDPLYIGNPIDSVAPTRSGYYEFDDGTLSTQNTVVGSQGTGTFFQNGGAHNVSSDLIIGQQNPVIERGCGPSGAETCSVGGPAQGTYTFNGGTLTVVGQVIVGDAGNGTFNQNADLDLSASGGIVIGRSASGTGTYNLATGVTLTDDLIVGDAGTGTFDNNGGTHNVTGNLILGNQSTGDGTYKLHDGGTLSITADGSGNASMIVGEQGIGTYKQGLDNQFDALSGNNSIITGDLVIGHQQDSFGQVFLQNGNLTVSGITFVGGSFDSVAGLGGVGTFTQNGGTLHTAFLDIGIINSTGNSFTLANDGHVIVDSDLVVGNRPGSTGTFTQMGAASQVDINSSIFGVFINNGTYDLQDGAFNVAANVVVGDGFGGAQLSQENGTASFGGALVLGSSSGVTGTFTMTGGILNATGNQDATFLVLPNDGAPFPPNQTAGPLGQAAGIAAVVGLNGIGVANQTGGAVTLGTAQVPNAAAGVEGDLIIGLNSGSQGTYNLGDATKAPSLTVNGSIIIGQNAGSNGGTTISSIDGTTAPVSPNLVINGNGTSLSVFYNGGSPGLNPQSSNLIVGLNGNGAVTQTDQSKVYTDGAVVLGGNLGGTGSYTLAADNAGGSLVNLSIGKDLNVGGIQSIPNGAQSYFQATNTTGGTGVFNLASGSMQTSGSLYLGNEGGTGYFNQTGGTTHFMQSAVIGNTGAGTYTQSAGTTTIDSELLIGNAPPVTGTYLLSGGNLNVTADVVVGVEGTGILTVSNGATAHNAGRLLIGGDFPGPSPVGTMTVTDPGTKWINNQQILVGNSGAGTLKVLNGGYLESLFGPSGTGSAGGLGFTSGVTGTVIVDGTGSQWNMPDGALRVGISGTGNLTISNGGNVTDTGNGPSNGVAAAVGWLAGSTGNVTITGANSTWTNNGNLVVGDAGTGTVTQGSLTTNTVTGTMTLGAQSTGIGTYNLNGGTLHDNVIIGDAGTGTFNNSAGTHNVSGDLVLGNQSTGNGTYNLSGTGVLNVTDTDARIIVGADGTGTFHQTGGNANASSLSVGNNNGSGTYTLDSGTLTVTGSAVNGGSVVGAAGTGVFTQNNGTHATTALVIGNNTGGNGTYNLNGGNLDVSGAVTIQATGSTGAMNMAGGALSAASMDNNGTVSYSAGSVVLGGGTGTLTNNTGGQVTFSGSGTRVVSGNLDNAGGVTLTTGAQVNVLNNNNGGTINLNANSLTVTKDYTNANFGTGNNFNPRAGVSGTGQIVGLNASQTITATTNPAALSGGSNTFTLDLGNVRGGSSTTVNYQIANNSSGADIRGAIQTGAPGAGSIIDGRLSGSGVTAANFGPIAAGGNSGNRSVTFNATSGGSLAGQSVAVVSNFGNVATQTINITGQASALAVGNATPNSNPVDLGSFRVGFSPPPIPSQNFDVTNSTGGAGAEQLGIFSANTSGNFTATNNLGSSFISGGGSQTNAVTASVNNGVAGVNIGSVTIQYTTNGTLIDPSFTPINANSQTINLQATGYVAAAGQLNTPALNFGTVQVGQNIQQALSISNIASGLTGFVEDLNASFGNSTGTGSGAISGVGSINGLLAGANNNSNMVVHVDTSVAGTISGAIGINYFTAGAVNGVSNGLGTAPVGTDSYGVSGIIQTTGQVVNQASPVINNSPINLGNVRIGATSPTGLVSVTNQATTAPQAALNASISGNGAITATGSFSLLNPGANDSTSLQVGMNTGTAGAINGIATLALVSDASNIGGCGTNCQMNLIPQNVQVTGNVFRLATGDATPAPLDLGNFRLTAATATGNLDVKNTAANDGSSEQLGVHGVTPSSGLFTATNNLGATRVDAQATAGSAITVGLGSGLVAGVNNGSVAIQYLSDGTVSGTGIPIDSNLQNVAVSATGYRLANPTLNTPSVTIAARVGDPVAANQAVSITNTSPDIYTEGLKVGVTGASGNAQSNGGSIANLAAQGTDNVSIKVGLASTATAGNTIGEVNLNLASTGAGTTGATDFSLASAVVNVVGKVYQQAVALVNTTLVDFGIVRVGSSPTAQNISISNTAAIAGLNDTLTANVSGLSGPFSGNGTVSGIAAQDSGNAAVSLNTATAGVYRQTATVILLSHDADLLDVSAGANAQVAVQAQVNNLANAVFGLSSGAGLLSGGGSSYTLNLGDILQGSLLSSSLFLENDVSGPADNLRGAFDLTALNDLIASSDWTTSPNLAAGASLSGLDLALNASNLGQFSDSITFAVDSWNADQGDYALGTITLNILGDVIQQGGGGTVPEPGSLALVGIALAGLAFARRRPKTLQQQH